MRGGRDARARGARPALPPRDRALGGRRGALADAPPRARRPGARRPRRPRRRRPGPPRPPRPARRRRRGHPRGGARRRPRRRQRRFARPGRRSLPRRPRGGRGAPRRRPRPAARGALVRVVPLGHPRRGARHPPRGARHPHAPGPGGRGGGGRALALAPAVVGGTARGVGGGGRTGDRPAGAPGPHPRARDGLQHALAADDAGLAQGRGRRVGRAGHRPRPRARRPRVAGPCAHQRRHRAGGAVARRPRRHGHAGGGHRDRNGRRAARQRRAGHGQHDLGSAAAPALRRGLHHPRAGARLRPRERPALVRPVPARNEGVGAPRHRRLGGCGGGRAHGDGDRRVPPGRERAARDDQPRPVAGAPGRPRGRRAAGRTRGSGRWSPTRPSA